MDQLKNTAIVDIDEFELLVEKAAGYDALLSELLSFGELYYDKKSLTFSTTALNALLLAHDEWHYLQRIKALNEQKEA